MLDVFLGAITAAFFWGCVTTIAVLVTRNQD
jgi:hypothetical protein